MWRRPPASGPPSHRGAPAGRGVDALRDEDGDVRQNGDDDGALKDGGRGEGDGLSVQNKQRSSWGTTEPGQLRVRSGQNRLTGLTSPVQL